MNPYVKNLNRIEFVITYGCTGRCKHCSEGDHSSAGQFIDPEAAARVVRDTAGKYDINSVMTFGGEPLLYPESVCAVHRAAMESKIPKRQIITNGFFSRDSEKIKRVAGELAGCGVNDILVSVVVCVSRPRRFGKSMAANMLAAYYDRECDSRELFADKVISRSDDYEEYRNQYDVIFLNIQQILIGAGDPEMVVPYLQKVVLEELREKYPEQTGERGNHLPTALADIYMRDSGDKKGFVFIIDEWDCIFREAQTNTKAQKLYLDFLKDLFKDRTYVALAYMTGILPIKKYGTHSALNVFDEYSMTGPEVFAEYIGFTEKEVEMLCSEYGKDLEEIKNWYDGYIFPEELHIYNPKSVVDVMKSRKPKSFWTNTETYEALQLYIDLDEDGLKEALMQMLIGQKCKIDTGAFQNDMTSFKSKDDVLTLLVHLGYLAYDEGAGAVYIPNEEVRGEFIRAIRNGGRPELFRLLRASDELMEATLHVLRI